ncbi:MAG: bifunctional glutamate N-acetyltransferase/amino-acid acetyltransferase ArgJ [Lachnospiraceae bacterium]|nr:bifunctional glutamate N-acetyltransferase/amino-acid acetyltransferase ArgJ [Lachnospiraceae bacterium]
MKITDHGITAAKGFKAAGTAAGIKYKDRPDMALLYSEAPCVVAGTFTSNVVKAAPVKWDMRIVEGPGPVRAVVVNSGIANACTKSEGMKACEETADKCAELLNISRDAVLIGSTGVIGMNLPKDRIKAGIEKLVPALSDSAESAHLAERAIMTTDTVPKEVSVEIEIDGKTVNIGGMSKGSGMIHPNMCTMLAYIATDVSITKEMLTKAVKEDVKDTFNMISVDGDTSTNDTFLVMANALAENKVIDSEGEAYDTFVKALHYVNETLAKKMAADGEGATALFETTVINADTKENARKLARSVISSSLTKAAIFGHDANFGRIICALGYSGVDFDPDGIDMFIGSKSGKILMFSDGDPADFSEEEATKILSDKEVTVTVDMKMGSESATAWGCDLSYDYVKINADYRS